MLFLLAVLAAVAGYFLLLGLLWVQQERIVFQPPIVLRGLFSSLPVGDRVRHVSYRAADGTELFAFLLGNFEQAARVLIAFHGNADLARNLIPWAEAVTQAADVAVLLAEIRGYDGLAGRPPRRYQRLAHGWDHRHVPESVRRTHALGFASRCRRLSGGTRV